MTRPPRIALYSHDTMGLGHMRRNLLLAQEFTAREPRPSVLLVAGSREISRFDVPRGVDVLSLPALYKDSASQYHARSLDVTLPEVVAMRSAAILGAIDAFAPDLFIVDNVPRGAVRELEPVLEHLRTRGLTRCVLGLRDILDDPTHVRAEWNRAGNVAAIRRYYDAVWVYGDEAVLDVAAEYDFPADVRRKLRYTGYLDQRRRSATAPEPVNGDRTLVPCFLGGGQDGLALACAFLESDLPSRFEPVLVTGPMMSEASRRKVHDVSMANPRVQVTEFLDDPAALMQRAHAVITMGGYNTICDVLSYEVRALIVPRVVPRTEQLIRARRLELRGLLDVLHPDALTPGALHSWVCTPAETRTSRPVRMHDGDDLRALLTDSMPLGSRQVRHAS